MEVAVVLSLWIIKMVFLIFLNKLLYLKTMIYIISHDTFASAILYSKTNPNTNVKVPPILSLNSHPCPNPWEVQHSIYKACLHKSVNEINFKSRAKIKFMKIISQ